MGSHLQHLEHLVRLCCNMRNTVIWGMGSTPAVRATFAGTRCTTARPPVWSRTARAPPVVPASVAVGAASSGHVAMVFDTCHPFIDRLHVLVLVQYDL